MTEENAAKKVPSHSAEDLAESLKDFESRCEKLGISKAEASRLIGVSPITAYRWGKDFPTAGYALRYLDMEAELRDIKDSIGEHGTPEELKEKLKLSEEGRKAAEAALMPFALGESTDEDVHNALTLLSLGT